MQIISLLILVILLGYVFKNEKSTYTRVIIGSIFGVTFLSVWPYFLYFADLYMLSEAYLLSAYIGLFLVAMSLSYPLVKSNYNDFIAAISFVIFVVITFFSFAFESNIKNFIAINSNYFSNSLPVAELNTQENRASHSNHNYTYTLSSDWIKKTDKGNLFEYYELYINNVKQLELRPRCFNADKSALSEIVNNTIISAESRDHSAKVQCYDAGQSNYACRVDSFNGKNITRSRWLRIDRQLKYGMELDFVIFNQQTNIREINVIIQSAIFNNADQNNINCLSITEWI
ncbi:MAG: hypothetical protein OQK98_10525 [Gammaproteobacteria bacterium]|nr:hypothetical protein [Gammaproteobacteria bacterium]